MYLSIVYEIKKKKHYNGVISNTLKEAKYQAKNLMDVEKRFIKIYTVYLNILTVPKNAYNLFYIPMSDLNNSIPSYKPSFVSHNIDNIYNHSYSHIKKNTIMVVVKDKNIYDMFTE
ncbi:MAG: hypothetical protein ACOCRK_01185 [bacterium]